MHLQVIFLIQRHLGEYDDDIDFTFGENTIVYKSCSAVLNDEMYVFGGDTVRNRGSHERQVNQYRLFSKMTIK